MACADPESLSEGSNTDNVFFLVDMMERGSKSH